MQDEKSKCCLRCNTPLVEGEQTYCAACLEKAAHEETKDKQPSTEKGKVAGHIPHKEDVEDIEPEAMLQIFLDEEGSLTLKINEDLTMRPTRVISILDELSSNIKLNLMTSRITNVVVGALRDNAQINKVAQDINKG